MLLAAHFVFFTVFSFVLFNFLCPWASPTFKIMSAASTGQPHSLLDFRLNIFDAKQTSSLISTWYNGKTAHHSSGDSSTSHARNPRPFSVLGGSKSARVANEHCSLATCFFPIKTDVQGSVDHL